MRNGKPLLRLKNMTDHLRTVRPLTDHPSCVEDHVRHIVMNHSLKRLQTIRHPRIITVQEKKIVSLRSVDAPSSGKKLTGVLLMNHSNSWILFRVSIQELCAAVFRAIVNNDQFPIRHALCLHRRNASV